MANGNGFYGGEEPGDPADSIAAINDEVVAGAGAGEGQMSLEESILGSSMGGADELEYEEFSLPEGIDVDKNILAVATEQFRMMGLSQKQAQGVIDLSPQITETIRNAQQKEWDATTASWANEIRNDPQIGGANFKNSIAKAERALRRFDLEGRLKEFLVSTKAGNNPDLIRFLVNIDDSISESSVSRAAAVGAKRELTDEEIFFPDNAPNKGVSSF